MAIAAIPTNVYLQAANGNTFLSWGLIAGATSYSVQRSTDGVTYAVVGTPAINNYLDSSVTVGTQYFYQVASVNGSGTSSYTNPQSIVPALAGTNSLGEIRLMAQQRADRVNSNFLTLPEWNSNINQSAFELYDILTTTYEDYYITSPITFTTSSLAQYNLSTICPNFYKLSGVDVGVPTGSTGYVTLNKFDFIQRNRYIFPQITSTALGVFNLRYRLVGSTLMFIPTPNSGQQMRIWYIPRMTPLLQDTDILDGLNGWNEYVIVDAAIKCLQKEESDVSVLMAQKMALIKRIEEAAMNRDAGAPDTISDTRTRANLWGSPGGLGYDGGFAGF